MYIDSEIDWDMILTDFRVGEYPVIDWSFPSSNISFIVSIFWGIYLLTSINPSTPLTCDLWFNIGDFCETSYQVIFSSFQLFFTVYRQILIGIALYSTKFYIKADNFLFGDVSSLIKKIGGNSPLTRTNYYLYCSEKTWKCLWLVSK